ncbi:MAG: VCBS repeat-containing protein [Lentisphaeria bacterium]|nr:VCBS repeat-containing protein [Lentisphaeria bacterium]
MSVIQVNSVWAGNVPGTEVAEGYYFGFNAFDNANDAINAAGANATVRIQGTGENTTPITRKSYMENLTVETPEGGSSHLCMHAGSTTYIYGEEAENGDAVRHEATVEYKNQDISFAGHSHFESLAGMTVKFTGSKVGHEGGTPFFKVYGDSNVVFDNSTYNAKNGNLWFYVSGQLDLQKNSLLNIETGSGFRILAAGGKVNVDESGLAVSNTNITIGSYYISSDKTAKAIVGGKKQGHDADGGNDYSATLNITNGRLVNKNGFVRVGASYILDDAATDEREGLTIKANPDKPADYADLAKAYLNITGSSAANLNELYVDGNGIVTVQDSSKLTAKTVTVDGKLTISHGSAMTVSGVLSVSGDSNAGRGITVDGTGFTSGTKAVISAGSIVWNKNILASGLETGMTLAVTNNAVYLTDQNQDTVYVGGKNADGVPEANTAGAGIAGWNAFDTILDAVNAIGMTPDKTVFDFGNAAKTYTGTVQDETDKVEFTQAGKYTFTGGELAHLPYLHGNAADAELVFDKAKLTLSKVKMEKGSSLTVMDSQLDFHPHSGDLAFLSLYNDGIMNVAGSVVGISDEMNDTDMPKAGKAGNSDTNGVYLAKDGMSRVSLNIQGQVNMTDSTLFASYRSRVLAGTRGQGEMNLKNSVMYADGLQILQATEDTGKATVNLDASALIQSHYSSSASLYSLVIGNDEAANAAAVISLTNGSLLDWSKAATARMPYEPWPASDSVVINTNGTLEIKGNSTAKTGNITNTGAIVIDNGKLEAAAVANNGTFSVSGTGDLSGSFSGNVFNFAAGAVLTSSKGFTFDGDYVTDSLTAIGAGEFSFGKLRFNVDKANPKSVEVKIGKGAVVKVANVMEIDRRTAKDPDAVDENVTGTLTLEEGAKVTVGTAAAKGWFYNKFEASTNISKGAELNVYGEFQNKGYFTVNGTLNLYSVSGLGMSAAGREDKGGIMNIDGGVVNYSDTDASKGWFGIGTKRQNNPTWDDATDTKTSELNITNGGQLNINLLEGNPYDTAFGIGQYGKLSVTGEGAAVNAASAGLQNNGEILLQDKANMTLGKLISNGTITVSNSTLTVSGDLPLNGSFSFDLASTITVGNLTNSGTITIDMNNVEAGQMFKLIDHTGTGTGSSYGDVTLINNAGSYRTIVIDNDLYALNVDMSVLKVNAAWAGTAAGTKVAEGYYLGINAFDALSATTGNIAKDGSDTTIEIGSDLTASGELEFDHGSGKVIFTAGSEGEKVINTGDVVFEKEGNANIVVGKDVTFNIADNINDFAVYYGNNLDLYGTIKGGQNYGSLYLYQGDHTIHAEGTLATGRLQSRYDSVTVLGAEGETRRYAEDVAVADRTDAQVHINFLFQESGTFAAKDTFVNVGAANGGDGHGIYDSNKGGVRDTNAPVFNFANTKLNAYQIQLQRDETTFGADGSVITITAEFNTNGTVNLTNTKLTVGKTLTNTGSFSFDLASTVTVGSLVNSSTITVDMTGASADTVLLIDYTGNGVMTLADYGSVTLSDANYSTMVINNDLYAVSQSLDLTDVAVNAAWAGTEIGKEVAEGKCFGLNAFDTTDSLSGLSAMKTLSITDTAAGSALDLTKFDSLAMTAVNSPLSDLTLANGSSLNLDNGSTANDITAAGSLTIAGDAAVNAVKTTAADAELNINGLTVNQGISGFTKISTNGATVKKGGITLTAGNDVMNVNGMLISMADGIDFLDGSNSLTLSSAASVVAYGIYAKNGSLDLTLTLADNVGKAIITVAEDGIFADAASTISLDVSKLQVGSYILVNNLSSFSKRIQVNGDTLGIGESLNINGMRYTLNYSNKTLSLDVTDFIVGNDIDNNGYADILMFNQKKEAALWLMKSNGTAEWKELFPFAGGDIADGWTLFDTGDTTGNNYSDVILYNEQDKDVGVWQMSDGETTWRTLERLDSDHELIAVRDFNGNGKRDILSRGTDGSIQFHYTDSGKTERFELSNEWKVVGAGDINGDGKADVIFQNGTKTGAWLTGAENEMPQWRDLYDLGTADNSILGTGDFDGNGIADVLIATKNSDGTVSYGTWLMNAQTEAQWRTLVTLPASVVIESISDINGDGKAELRVRNGNDIASISMSVSLDSNTVLTQWNSHGPVTDEWTTKLASPIL